MERGQEEKGALFPTRILKAMDLYERGELPASAEIFKQLPHPLPPIARPYCFTLGEEGFLENGKEDPFTACAAQQKVNIWFDAAEECAELDVKTPLALEEMEKGASGQRLYHLGCRYDVLHNLQKALNLFVQAFEQGDFRGVLKLGQAIDATQKKGLKQEGGDSFLQIRDSFISLSQAHEDEGDIFRTLYEKFGKKMPALSQNFLYLAAQFGHTPSQIDWAKSLSEQHTGERLFWLIEAEKKGDFEALRLLGSIFSSQPWVTLEGNQNIRIPFYLRRLANHPEAKIDDLCAWGVVLETGIHSVEKNYEEALSWYKKACLQQNNDKKANAYCGRALVLLGRDTEALPYLKKGKGFDPDARALYEAVCTAKATPAYKRGTCRRR